MSTPHDGVVDIDLAREEVTIGGKVIELTEIESRVLWTLVRHKGHVLAPDALMAMSFEDYHSDRRPISYPLIMQAVAHINLKLGGVEDLSPIGVIRGFGLLHQ
jgi:DNA-binding response OmpR family regulator